MNFILSPLMYSYISISQKDKRTDYPGREISDLVQKNNNKIKLIWARVPARARLGPFGPIGPV